MKNTILLFLFALFIPAAHAQFIPYPATVIDTSESRIFLGRGIRAKGTDQSLALLCETNQCNSLRYVVFSKKQAYAFGPTIYKASANLDQLNIKRKERPLRAGRGALLLIGSTIGAIFLAPISTAPIAILFGLDVIGALQHDQGPYFQAFDLPGHVARALQQKKSPSQEGKVFLEKDGWNWSSSPQRMNALRFCETLASILEVPHNARECNVAVGPNSFVCDYSGYVDVCTNNLNYN